MRLETSAVYMDANATLPLKLEAKNAMMALMETVGNPSAIHSFGRQLRAQIEQAREKIAHHLHVQPAQVIFTSSGTEANNLALNYYKDKRVLVSSIEHLSILDTLPQSIKIPVTSKGIIDLKWLENTLHNSKVDLIAVMYANNETGIIQPLQAVVDLALKYTVKVHTDAVQALGKYPLDFNKLGVDSLSISAHKIGGPQGIGALIVTENTPIVTLLKGGGQERRRRAGTENSLGIIGFAAAIEASSLEEWDYVQVLRDQLEKEIKTIAPQVLIISASVDRLPNTTSLRMPGVEAQKQLMGFDLKGFAVSAGSACSSGKVSQSHVLEAMGIATNDVIRISLGPHNTLEDIATFVEAWKTLYAQFSTREKK